MQTLYAHAQMPYSHLVTGALHIKATERAVGLRLSRSVVFLALEPLLRVYRHGVTLTEWVGQRLSMQIESSRLALTIQKGSGKFGISQRKPFITQNL
jgi:hypothetical protein